MNKVLITTAVALGVAALTAIAQDGPPKREQGPQRPPPPPLIAALDANHDGVIDEAEIANASAALKTLDKNGDGKLTREELRPPRPEGQGALRGQGRPQGRPPGPPPPPEE